MPSAELDARRPRRRHQGRSGEQGRGGEAAITRTEAVNPALNALACQAFDQARAKALERGSDGEFFGGAPTFVKDCVDVAGLPTMSGSDAWTPVPAAADSDCTRQYLATGLISLGKTQMPELGLSGSAEHPRLGPVRNPWNTDYTAGGSVIGRGRVGRRRCGADRARQRRRWFGPNSGILQRIGGPGSRRGTGYRWMAGRAWCRFVSSPTDVLTRSVRDTAAFYRGGRTCLASSHAAAADRRRAAPRQAAAAESLWSPARPSGSAAPNCVS